MRLRLVLRRCVQSQSQGQVEVGRSGGQSESEGKSRWRRREQQQVQEESKSNDELYDELQRAVAAQQAVSGKRFTQLIRRATTLQWPQCDLNTALRVYHLAQQQHAGNNYLYAEMIAACTRCKRTDIAQTVYAQWCDMRHHRNMEGGLLVYEAMIAHYAEANDPRSVAAVYEQLRDQGLVPSPYAAATLASSFCNFGETDKALALVRQPGNESWMASNAIINALCREGKMDEALEVLQDSTKLGFSATEETYNNLLRGAAASGQSHAIDVILTHMSNHKLTPSEQTWRFVLLGYAYAPPTAQPRLPDVQTAYRKAKACAATAKTSLDPRTAGAAVLATLRCHNDVNNAMSILKNDLINVGAPVPFMVWTRMIDCYDRQFNKSEAWRRKGKGERNQARDGALMKLFYMLRSSEEAQRKFEDGKSIASNYSQFRWRKCYLDVISKLRLSENALAVYDHAVSAQNFFEPVGKEDYVLQQWREHLLLLHRSVLTCLFRDEKIDEVFLFWKRALVFQVDLYGDVYAYMNSRPGLERGRASALFSDFVKQNNILIQQDGGSGVFVQEKKVGKANVVNNKT